MDYPTLHMTIPGYGWHVEYYELTEGDSMAFQEAIEDEDTYQMKEILIDLIKKWDCTDRDGDVLSLVPGSLDKLPASVLKYLIPNLLLAGKNEDIISPKSNASSSLHTPGADGARKEDEIPG